MSNKANARKYSGMTAPSEGGFLPGVGEMFGAGKVTGGLTQNPDGTWSYAAPTVAHPVADKWLMGGAGAKEAAAMRNSIEPQLFLAQEAMKKQTELERIRAALIGEENDKKHGYDVETENLKHNNAIALAFKQGQISALQAHGIIPRNNEDIQVAGEGLNDPIIRNTLAKTQQSTRFLTDPRIQTAADQNEIDKLQAQGLANRNAATIRLGANDTAFMFDPKAPRDPNTMMQLGGVRQLGETITSKLDEFGKPVSTTSTVQTAPGQIQRYPVAQSLLEAAGKLAPGGVNVDLDGTDTATDANNMLEFFRKYVSGRIIH